MTTLVPLTELEKLQDYAYARRISIFLSYRPSECKGFCMRIGAGRGVTINKCSITSEADELCTLAEELGHIETGTVLPAGDYVDPYYKRYLKRHNENRAHWDAIQRLLPPEKLQDAVDIGHRSVSGIAGYCGVTAEFAEAAILYYERKGYEFE